ncbi:MAG: hypothetical protein WKF70_01520 [Chitinophagaceae bacterium]
MRNKVLNKGKNVNGIVRRLRQSVFLLLLILGVLPAQAEEPPRYIFVNAVPGKAFKIGRPSSFNRKFFDDVIRKIDAPLNTKLRVGISVLFDYLAVHPDSVQQCLERFMALSTETGVPILINLDGINWLGARPDLWNWWDPKMPGYNPANKQNVEWTGWDQSTALKISWRNWGKQLRVLPAPNLASPAIINAQITALNRLIPRIRDWYQQLPADKKYLLGGVKLGHETSIGVNAYFYKEGNRYLEQMPKNNVLDPADSYNAAAGFSGGLAHIGYAAVKTAGIRSQGRLTAFDLEQVVHHYLDTLCKTAVALGLSKSVIYTHQGGTFAPWQEHLSFAAASNGHSLPGWSLYTTDPSIAGDLGDVLDRRVEKGWAAVEWWWPGKDKTGWIYNLQTTLQYKDCRLIAIFNWENGLENYPDGIEALREVVMNWK